MKILFIAVMLLCMVVSNTHAQTVKEQPAGMGTEEDPYQISTLGNLSWLTQSMLEQNKIYIQTADIDASETRTWDMSDDDGDGDKFNDPNDLTLDGDNDGWQPVAMFSGSYNGKGYVIDSLYINTSSSGGTGFFAIISGGTIENLGITNVDISGPALVGVLAATCKENIVNNCYTSGKLTLTPSSDSYKYGGFFANIVTGISEITNCHSDVIINANKFSKYVAGFVGNIKGVPFGEISGCYAAGDILNGGGTCAGFVAKNEAEDFIISKCYSSGDVYALERAGGFVGYNKNGTVIEDCYSLGDVMRIPESSELDLGGFCGYNKKSTIKNSYAVGSVLFADTVITDKGFSGRNTGEVIACFFDSTVSNQKSDTSTISGPDSMAIAKTTLEMQSDSTFIAAGWDFTDTWEIIDGSYPTFKQVSAAVDDKNLRNLTPKNYELKQNYPNPFNPTTMIGFTLKTKTHVNLTVYDIVGRKIVDLVNRDMSAGYHEVNFKAMNLSSGVYVYKLSAGDYIAVKKMMLIK